MQLIYVSIYNSEAYFPAVVRYMGLERAMLSFIFLSQYDNTGNITHSYDIWHLS